MIKIFKLLFIIGFIFTINTYTYSQENAKNIKWSKGIKDYGHGIINLGKTNKYMLIQINNHKPDIALLSLTNFSPVKQVKAFSPRIKDRVLTYEKSIVFNNRLIVVAKDSITQFVLKYNIPDLNLIEATEIGDIVPLENITNEGQKATLSIKNTVSPIEFIKTNEGNKLVVLFSNRDMEKKIGYIYLSIDKKNKEKLQKQYFDIYLDRFEILQNLISNKGVLYTVYRGLIKDKDYVYFLCDGKVNKVIPFELQIKINHLRLVENQDFSISFVGIGQFEGNEFFFEIPYIQGEKSLREIKKIQLNEQQKSNLIKSQLMGNEFNATIKNSEKTQLFMENYSIDGIKQINDELRLIYGENYDLTLKRNNKYNVIRHEAKELYVCVFNEMGEIVFFNTFIKTQVFENLLDRKPSWGSYLFFETDSSYNYIYCGEEMAKEVSSFDSSKPFKPTGKSNITTQIVVNKDLTINMKKWPSYSKEQVYISPFISLDYGNGRLIIGSENEYDKTKQIYKFGKYINKK